MLCVHADVFEHEFLLIAADTPGRNIYQLGGLAGDDAERLIVRLLSRDSRRRPVSVAFDELRRLVYWTDVAGASVNRRPLTTNYDQPTVIYAAGIIDQLTAAQIHVYTSLLGPSYGP